MTRLFLGLQTQCTQCHDHPFNKEWVQSDFWGVNAFFRQTVRSANPTRGAATAPQHGQPDDRSSRRHAQRRRSDLLRAAGREADGVEAGVSEGPRPGASGREMEQAPPARREGQVPAEKLAEYVVKHDNFAKAYVNRIWGHLFGRGLNKEPAVDDFGSHNEVIHPELLDELAKQFNTYEYDPKKLLKWICLSRRLQPEPRATKEIADPKFDAFFARMPLKALSPEVLFESFQAATPVPAGEGGHPSRPRYEGRLDFETGQEVRGRRGERAHVQRHHDPGPDDDERHRVERARSPVRGAWSSRSCGRTSAAGR